MISTADELVLDGFSIESKLFVNTFGSRNPKFIQEYNGGNNEFCKISFWEDVCSLPYNPLIIPPETTSYISLNDVANKIRVLPDCRPEFAGCSKRSLPIYSTLTGFNYYYHPKCTQSIFKYYCEDDLPSGWTDISDYEEITFTEENYNSCISNPWCGSISIFTPPNYSSDEAYLQAWYLPNHNADLDLLIDSVLNSGHCNTLRDLGVIRNSVNQCLKQESDIEFYELFDVLDTQKDVYVNDLQDLKNYYQVFRYIPDNLFAFEVVNLLDGSEMYLYRGCAEGFSMSLSDLSLFDCDLDNTSGVEISHSIEGIFILNSVIPLP